MLSYLPKPNAFWNQNGLITVTLIAHKLGKLTRSKRACAKRFLATACVTKTDA